MKQEMRYFIFSKDYNESMNNSIKNSGQRFECGTVTYRGKKYEYSLLSRTPKVVNHSDAKVICQLDINNPSTVYTTPKNVKI